MQSCFRHNCILEFGNVSDLCCPESAVGAKVHREPAENTASERDKQIDRQTDRPFAVHLRAEVDLEVLRVVKHIEEGAALIKLGDAAENEWTHSQTLED